MIRPPSMTPALPLRGALFWGMAAVVAFHLAYAVPRLSVLIFGYLFGLLQMSRLASTREAFYSGLGVGLLTVAPQLSCFWVIFGAAAIVLWVILAAWIGLFVALSRLCRVRLGNVWGWLLIPFIWTGLYSIEGTN